MTNNTPEWFNQQEFDQYVTERYNVNSQKAERDVARIFAKAKQLKRQIMATSSPSRLVGAIQDRAAVAERASRRAARKRAAADVLDAKASAERLSQATGMKMENVDLDQEYLNFLSEAAKKGSQRDFNTGTKESPGQRAKEKNSTGDPKKQAKLKKREQRKDQRGPKPAQSGEKKKSRAVLAKGSAKDPGKFIGVRVKEGKEKGVVEIIPKADYDPNKHEVIVGSSERNGRKATLGELSKLASEETFQATKSSDYLGISKGKKEKAKDKRKGKDKDEAKARRKSAGDKKEESDEEEEDGAKGKKEKSPKGKTKKKKKSSQADQDAGAQPNQAQMVMGPNGQPMPLNIMPGPVPGAKLSVPPFSGQAAPISWQLGTMATTIAMLARDHGANEALDSLFTSKKKKASERYARMQQNLNENPQLVQIGEQQMQTMISDLIMRNPAFAKYAEDMDENDYIQEFTFINSDLMRACIEPSKEFQKMGVSDTTAKSDIMIFPTKLAKSILSKVTPKKEGKEKAKASCDFTDEELSLIDGYSYKQGKAQIASAQQVESAAVLESVIQKIDLMLSNPKTKRAMENMLFTGGGQDNQYLFKLRQMLQILKDLNQLVQKKAYFSDTSLTLAKINDPINSQLIAMANPQADAQLKQIKTKLKELDELANEIIKNPIIKALIIHEQLTGDAKYARTQKNVNPVITGRASAVLFLNAQGFAVGSMAIPSIEELLEGPSSENPNVQKFYLFVRDKEIRGSVKPRKSSSGLFFNPVVRAAPRAIGEDFGLNLDGLDTLFEAEFQPADINLISTSNNLSVDPVDDVAKRMKAEDEEMEQQMQDEFVPFDGMDPEEYAKAVNYNVFRIIKGAGFEFTNITVSPFDAEEAGIMLSSVDSDKFNYMVYNGREFKIPVISSDMNESSILEYEDINEMCVDLIKNGEDAKEILELFLSVTRDMLTEKRNYKREYAKFHGKPEQRAKRSKRVLARRKMIKKYGKKALKGKDIDHKDGNANNNGDHNLRVRSINSNRADNKHRKGEIKEAISKKPNWLNKLTGSWEYTEFLSNAVPGQKIIDKALRDILTRNKGQSQ